MAIKAVELTTDAAILPAILLEALDWPMACLLGLSVGGAQSSAQ